MYWMAWFFLFFFLLYTLKMYTIIFRIYMPTFTLGSLKVVVSKEKEKGTWQSTSKITCG